MIWIKLGLDMVKLGVASVTATIGLIEIQFI